MLCLRFENIYHFSLGQIVIIPKLLESNFKLSTLFCLKLFLFLKCRFNFSGLYLATFIIISFCNKMFVTIRECCFIRAKLFENMFHERTHPPLNWIRAFQYLKQNQVDRHLNW